VVDGSKQKARCERQVEMCMSISPVAEACRKISKPVEGDVGMAIIRRAVIELDTDWMEVGMRLGIWEVVGKGVSTLCSIHWRSGAHGIWSTQVKRIGEEV